MYRGSDFHIHELSWRSGLSVQHNDLTVAAGAPIAQYGPTAYVLERDGTQHVVYMDADFSIHELWWSSSSGWQHNNLTAATGAPVAHLSLPDAYPFQGQYTQHVVYVAGDGHVHELWWGAGTGWRHSDLTRRANAPSVPFENLYLTGYAYERQRTQHVMYANAGGHIHELWWGTDGDVHHTDLTDKANAPSPLGVLNARADEEPGQVPSFSQLVLFTRRSPFDDRLSYISIYEYVDWGDYPDGGPVGAGDVYAYQFGPGLNDFSWLRFSVYVDTEGHIHELHG